MHDIICAVLKAVVDKPEVIFGKVGMPARLAVTGGTPSPDLDLVINLVGKDTCWRRFDIASILSRLGHRD